KAAKANGRNSFSIRILKRAGGTLCYTARWGFGGTDGNGPDLPYKPETFKSDSAKVRSPMSCLFELRDALALPGVSRRAAYHAVAWLEGMPSDPLATSMSLDEYTNMLADALAYQFHRHGIKAESFHRSGIALMSGEDPAAQIARSLVDVALRQCRPQSTNGQWLSVPEHLTRMLLVAEFLAREGRALAPATKGGRP
ncbi:MAG: hypothetical protein ACK42L_09070, partial [Thermoanaerobaculum sp.]